jgi:hypothetical protein
MEIGLRGLWSRKGIGYTIFLIGDTSLAVGYNCYGDLVDIELDGHTLDLECDQELNIRR